MVVVIAVGQEHALNVVLAGAADAQAVVAGAYQHASRGGGDGRVASEACRPGSCREAAGKLTWAHWPPPP
jgi:hypothetical protein